LRRRALDRARHRLPRRLRAVQDPRPGRGDSRARCRVEPERRLRPALELPLPRRPDLRDRRPPARGIRAQGPEGRCYRSPGPPALPHPERRAAAGAGEGQGEEDRVDDVQGDEGSISEGDAGAEQDLTAPARGRRRGIRDHVEREEKESESRHRHQRRGDRRAFDRRADERLHREDSEPARIRGIRLVSLALSRLPIATMRAGSSQSPTANRFSENMYGGARPTAGRATRVTEIPRFDGLKKWRVRPSTATRKTYFEAIAAAVAKQTGRSRRFG